MQCSKPSRYWACPHLRHSPPATVATPRALPECLMHSCATMLVPLPETPSHFLLSHPWCLFGLCCLKHCLPQEAFPVLFCTVWVMCTPPSRQVYSECTGCNYWLTSLISLFFLGSSITLDNRCSANDLWLKLPGTQRNSTNVSFPDPVIN